MSNAIDRTKRFHKFVLSTCWLPPILVFATMIYVSKNVEGMMAGYFGGVMLAPFVLMAAVYSIICLSVCVDAYKEGKSMWGPVVALFIVSTPFTYFVMDAIMNPYERPQ